MNQPQSVATQSEQAARATAEWWADHVFGSASGSSGDGLIDAFALLAGAQGKAAEPSKRDRFVETLTARVVKNLERDGAERFGITLSVDYGPEGALAQVAQEIGIGGGSFPWKTSSYTYPDHATAAAGYGGRTALIWQAEGWERPSCGQGQWDLDKPRGGRLPWKCSGLQYHEDEHTFDVPDLLCASTVERHGEPEACGRPANDSDHRLDDEYLSRWAHEFKAGA